MMAEKIATKRITFTLLSGCTVAVDQKSLLPDLKPPTAALEAPPG